MSYEQRQIVQDCFSGACDRNCTYCRAHYTRGGICCFGHKYEDGDKECEACIHVHACSQSQYAEQHPHRVAVNAVRPRPTQGYSTPRPVYANHRPVYANQPQQQRAVTPYRSGPLDDLLRKYPPDAPRIPMEWQEGTTFMGQLGTVVGWGMVEGGLELALDFFRRRRPE